MKIKRKTLNGLRLLASIPVLLFLLMVYVLSGEWVPGFFDKVIEYLEIEVIEDEAAP
jgi:hypothetical protein